MYGSGLQERPGKIYPFLHTIHDNIYYSPYQYALFILGQYLKAILPKLGEIMKTSNTISFTKLGSFDIPKFQDLYKSLLATKYSDEQGFGFSHVSMSQNSLSASLIKRVPTTIPRFDLDIGQFIDEQIFLFSEIDFVISKAFNLIEIYGPVKNAPKVRVALYSLFHPEVQVTPIQFRPSAVYRKLLQAFTTITVDNLVVNNFQHKEGVIGRYTIKSAELNLVSQIISQYGHDVARLTCSVTNSVFGDFTFSISNNGSLRINCDEDQFLGLVNEMKSILFTQEGK